MDCEQCAYYAYDEEYEEYTCTVSYAMDEDDLARRMGQGRGRNSCPYFRNGDEYLVVRHQM